jgi:hypothetical protein
MGRATRFAIGLLLYAVAIPVHATTITVTNTNDSGPGSLRQAIAFANDGDMIRFAVTGTIILTSGGIGIDKDITISGPGADQLSIDGNHAELQSVFGIGNSSTVTIFGLTITHAGGGFYNDHSTLTISNCVVTGHSTGGIENNGSHGPTLAPIRSGNHRPDSTKMYEDCFAGACLTVNNSIISDNSGPGISNTGNLTIVNSTLSGNSAGQGLDGGGIVSGGFKEPGLLVMITNSTISGNSASDAGGGIAAEYCLVSIVNSTISGNSAGTYGGGISNNSGTVQIANSTLSGNSAPTGFAGGIYSSNRLEIGNTIFNAGASGENIVNNGGMVISHGYNVCSDDGGGYLNGTGDQINTDPLLGPLQNNGGSTFTHALLSGSPAIDAGDPNFSPPPFNDQRGCPFDRVFNGRIDIGSFETQPPRRPCSTPRPRPTPPPRP